MSQLRKLEAGKMASEGFVETAQRKYDTTTKREQQQTITEIMVADTQVKVLYQVLIMNIQSMKAVSEVLAKI
jgi:hypothetical protein